jgi:hypothetical protein
MAQTKRRSTSARPKSARRSKPAKAGSTAKNKPAAKARRRPAKSGAARSGSGNDLATDAVEAIRDTVQDKAKSAGKGVGKAAKVAGKAKVPLVAGGAALAGMAGGIALGTRRRGHRGGIAQALRKPTIKVDSSDVARVAKGVGSFSNQVGALASELQRNREAAGNGRHRSPVEVVLQGLTSRD